MILSSTLFSLFITTYLLPLFRKVTKSLSIFAVRFFAYSFILSRHGWVGPWTVGAAVIQGAYITANLLCVLFRVSSFPEAALRAGRLSLINMMPLFLSPHLGLLADLFGLSIRGFRKIHYSSGGVSFALMLFHVVVMMLWGKLQDVYVSMV